jgi:hypothetical protein
MVVSDPERVQLGADAQALRRRHPSNRRALDALRIGMAGKYAYAAFHRQFLSMPRPLVLANGALVSVEGQSGLGGRFIV